MDYLNIKLEATDENTYSLSDFKGQKVVVYFYPRDNTPGCTIENKDFSCLVEQFTTLNTKVIGVSRDSIKSHHNFISKQELNVLLLSDSDELLCNAFDVIKEKMMYGKKVVGIERSTFLLNEEGQIIKEYRKVKTKGHAEQVLNDLKEIN